MKKAMLAHKFDDKRVDWSQPVYIQPKLDGVRCLFTKDGAYSRTGKQFMNIAHIELRLIPFFKQHPDVILDGELYNHELKDDFEKIISLVRKQKPTKEHIKEAKKLVQYHIYDIIEDNTLYTDRHKYLCRIFNQENFLKGSIKLVDTYPVIGLDAVEQCYKAFLKDGYEGSIIRVNGAYKPTRSWNLQKIKDFHDTEATIIGYEVGKGKRKGHLGKFIMQDDNGVEFGCPPGKGYTYKDMKEMLENIDDYIGERATFTYFQKTKAGSYRHPLFKGLRNYE